MRYFRFATMALGLQLALLNSTAQEPTQALPPASLPQQPAIGTAASGPPLTEQLRSTVAFLTIAYQNGPTQDGVIGTCFFVFFPDKRLGENRGFIYVVTNRHVAQPGIDLGTPYQVRGAYIRLNLASPEQGIQSVAEQIPLNDQLHWFFPSDDAVDLAILPVAPNENRYTFRTIPLSIIATSDLFKADHVGVGNSVIFAGYFRSFSGQNRMEPIVRQGVIAMLPQENLDTTLHKKGQLILADLHAFHGNSGSPVFANVGGVRGGMISGDNYILLGVISGYYPESAGFSVPAATILTGVVRDNSGIATIVPGEELTKLLNSREVQADRDHWIPILMKKP